MDFDLKEYEEKQIAKHRKLEKKGIEAFKEGYKEDLRIEGKKNVTFALEGFRIPKGFEGEKPSRSYFSSTPSLYYQLPLYDAVIVKLRPSISPESFELKHGFKLKDIDSLIDFAKETGRVNFVVHYPLCRYEHMDYLEPIFKELKPPIMAGTPLKLLEGEEFKKYSKEIITAYPKEPPDWFKRGMSLQSRSPRNLGILRREYRNMLYSSGLKYASLRILGYDFLADKVIDSKRIGSFDSLMLLDFLSIVILRPHFDFLCSTYSLDKTTLQIGNFFSKKRCISKEISPEEIREKFEFKHEIGKYLTRKLSRSEEVFTKIPVSKSFLGCQELIGLFKSNELYNISEGLLEGLERKDVDILEEKSGELFETLDNIWEEASKIKKFKRAVDIGFGIVGGLASLFSGLGLLADLGFKTGDSISDSKITWKVSEKLSKLIKPNYLYTIYNFQKKHKL